VASTSRGLSNDTLREFATVAQDELRALFERVVREAGDETVYLFALTVTYRHLSPFVVANSVEALDRREGLIYREQGVTGYELDPWDPGQWRWVHHCERASRAGERIDEQWDALTAEHPERTEEVWESIRTSIDEVYLAALETFDRDRLFGRSRASGDAAVLLMDEQDFTEDDWRRIFRRLNPPAIEARLLRDWRLEPRA
jgi:hypothetical protein